MNNGNERTPKPLSKLAQPSSNRDSTQLELDTDALIERRLWDVYYAGKKDAEKLRGSNREVLRVKAEIVQLITRAELQGELKSLRYLRKYARTHDSRDTTTMAWQILDGLEAKLAGEQ